MEFGLVALWLLLFLALLAGAMPLASVVFPRMADRGAGVAIPLALSVVWLVAYVVGRFSLALALGAGFVALVALVGVVVYRGEGLDVAAYRETAAVFTVAFLFLIAVRAVDPGVHPYAGEKFLDYGILKAVLRADSLPPEDFWYAGSDLMYYYGGHLLVALLSRLTETSPNYAYNLALSGFYATFVTAAYGLAGSIAARTDAFERRAAVLAAFFVGFASNLMTPLRLLLAPLPTDVARPIAEGLGVWVGRTGTEGNVVTGVKSFHPWDASGVIGGTINEFPLFAWVNGDLHGHMMSPTFTLLLVAVLYSYYRTPARAWRRRLALVFGVVPLLGALLAVFNTWSFPAVTGLTFLTLLFAPASPGTMLRGALARLPTLLSPEELRRLVGALLAAAAVTVLGICWSLPFWLANSSGRTVAFLPDRSSLPKLLVVHGVFLLPIALYLGYVAWARYDLSTGQVGALLGVVAVGVALSAVGHVAAVGILAPVLLGGYLLGRDRFLDGGVDAESRDAAATADGGAVSEARFADEPADVRSWPGFELVLILAGAGLVLAVEFVYLEENAGPGRFNTVFKTYAQVWAFWAVASAVAFGRLLQSRDYRVPLPRWNGSVRVALALLVVGTSFYGVFLLGGHFSGGSLQTVDDPTLDGTAYVEQRHPDEARAIEWLDAREGTPTMVTKPGTDIYGWANAPSSLTGVPTVVGWVHHEKGFGRPPDEVEQRADDVGDIYTGSPDEQRRLLAKYDVQYVYVGPREREGYDSITVDELPSVTPAHQSGSVTIYRVDRESSSD